MRHGVELAVVACGQSRLHVGRQHQARALHAERSRDSRLHERLVVHARPPGEHGPEKPPAEVRVSVLRADIARQRVTGQELRQRLDAIVGVRVGRVLRCKIRRHPRESRRVRDEILECDRASPRSGTFTSAGRYFAIGSVMATSPR